MLTIGRALGERRYLNGMKIENTWNILSFLLKTILSFYVLVLFLKIEKKGEFPLKVCEFVFSCLKLYIHIISNHLLLYFVSCPDVVIFVVKRLFFFFLNDNSDRQKMSTVCSK